MAQKDGPKLLRTWMNTHGMSQREMSGATGIRQQAISRYLLGNGVRGFSSSAARTLAGMTGIPVEKLMRDVVMSKTERSLKTSGQKVA